MGSGHSLVALPQWYREWTMYYGKKGFQMASQSAKWDTSDAKDLTGKVHMVTGANAGIGFEASKELAKRNGVVHMLCRNKLRGEEARKSIVEATGNQQVFLHAVDVSSTAQVRAFAADFLKSHDRLDALVHNAGVLPTERVNSAEGLESCFATAMGGTFLLCGLLLPALKKAAPSVVFSVSSAGMYTAKTDVNDLQYLKWKKYDGFLQYARVKRAQIAVSEIWAEKLAGTGVSVHSMHPGYAVTPGTEKLPGIGDKKEGGFMEQHRETLRSAEEGADTIVWMCASPKLKETAGKFWFDRREVQTSFPFSGTELSKKEKQKVWNQCEELFGFKYGHDASADATN